MCSGSLGGAVDCSNPQKMNSSKFVLPLKDLPPEVLLRIAATSRIAGLLLKAVCRGFRSCLDVNRLGRYVASRSVVLERMLKNMSYSTQASVWDVLSSGLGDVKYGYMKMLEVCFHSFFSDKNP